MREIIFTWPESCMQPQFDFVADIFADDQGKCITLNAGNGGRQQLFQERQTPVVNKNVTLVEATFRQPHKMIVRSS
jgi:hypothetical protein